MKKALTFASIYSFLISTLFTINCFAQVQLKDSSELTKSYLIDIQIPEVYTKEKKDRVGLNLCLLAQSQIEKSEIDKTQVKCDFDQRLDPENFDYHLSFYFLGDRFRLSAKIHKTKTLAKDMQYSWDVKNNPYAIGKIIHRFVQFKDDKNLIGIEDHALKAGVGMSQEITLDSKGNFVSKKKSNTFYSGGKENISCGGV